MSDTLPNPNHPEDSVLAWLHPHEAQLWLASTCEDIFISYNVKLFLKEHRALPKHKQSKARYGSLTPEQEKRQSVASDLLQTAAESTLAAPALLRALAGTRRLLHAARVAT